MERTSWMFVHITKYFNMYSLQKITLTALAVLFLNACTEAGLFVANVPSTFNNATTYSDIIYDRETGQKLDLYVPQNARNAPVLVFLYGGRWTFGQKEQYRFVANRFLTEGYIVVIPDYRKYPAVKFPAFVKDAAAAIAWTHKNIGDYNGDPNMIFLSGHSSGAHLGALVSTDPQYLKEYGLRRSVIKGFVGLSGPYAFEPQSDDLKAMFGPPEQYPRIRANNFVDGGQPPMLLIQGLDDGTVALQNTKKLKAAIENQGGQVEMVTYPDIDHSETIGSLMWYWRHKSNIKEEMITFFESQRR